MKIWAIALPAVLAAGYSSAVEFPDPAGSSLKISSLDISSAAASAIAAEGSWLIAYVP